jgi:hypothetical protein
MKTKNSKTSKSVEVRDMKAKKNPKGGALNAYVKLDTVKADGSVTNAINFSDVSSLNFKK